MGNSQDWFLEKSPFALLDWKRANIYNARHNYGIQLKDTQFGKFSISNLEVGVS